MYVKQIKQVLARVAFVLLLFVCAKALFFVCNYKHNAIAGHSIIKILLHGLRYDFVAVAMLGIPFIILSLLPFRFVLSVYMQHFIALFYILVFSFTFIFEWADVVYFPFNHKRTTFDIFSLVGRKGDFVNLLPSFIKDYWYIILLIILTWILLFIIAQKTKLSLTQNYTFKPLALVYTALGWGVLLIGIRGGLQLKPLSVVSAATVNGAASVPFVVNSSFSIIKSYGNRHLQQFTTFTYAQIDSIIPTQYKPKTNIAFTPKNVIFIILESMSREYTAIGDRTSYTPFLDSIFSQSEVFTNAYANAVRSAEGIPAIIAGIPAMMEEPFTTSPYGNNNIMSMPKLLNKMGYSSYFFHGGTDGSMSFDAFASLAGYNKYIGRNYYNNDKDFDGNWGISDQPFLQFTAQELGKIKTPFFASVFTLTSHHPFEVPAACSIKFPEGKHPIHKTIGYTDYALRQFFNLVKTQAWYSNTIFVFTADHCGPATEEAKSNRLGGYQIPIAIYEPNGGKAQVSNNLFQQIDIIPTLADKLHYPYPFTTFGQSAYDTTRPRRIISYLDGFYQFIQGDYILYATQKNITGLYNTKTDSLMRNNLVNEGFALVANAQYKNLQAYIQKFNHLMEVDSLR